MKIDYTFKIKEKYFKAILSGEKTFELRHEWINSNNIVKLECDNGNYLIYKSGGGEWLEKARFFREKNTIQYIDGDYLYVKFDNKCYLFRKNIAQKETKRGYEKIPWYDMFCWDYINETYTFLSLIDEILEVSINDKKWISLRKFVEKQNDSSKIR